MKNLAIARRYAKALMLIGKDDGQTETYRKELEGVTELIAEQGKLAETIANPLFDLEARKKVFHAVLAAVLFLILRKPMSQALKGRIQGIKQQLEDLEQKKKAAEKSLAECKERIALLNKEAERLVEEYIRQGEEAKARIMKEAEASAEKLKEQASKNIEHEFEQAKGKLQAEIVEQALAKAEQVIAKKITDNDQTKLVDEYLEKVVA